MLGVTNGSMVGMTGGIQLRRLFRRLGQPRVDRTGSTWYASTSGISVGGAHRPAAAGTLNITNGGTVLMAKISAPTTVSGTARASASARVRRGRLTVAVHGVKTDIGG